MPKFMFIYRDGPDTETDFAPERMQEVLKAWGDWIQGGFKEGWMVDGGSALEKTGAIVAPDKTVTDGPYVESKEMVGGYSMVEAADLAAALKLTEGCPILPSGGTIEVRELMVLDIPTEAP